MPYEKDIYGNVIGTGGDDTSLQDAKMAGYPGYNMFDKQREAAVLTQGEIEGKTGVSLGGTAAGNGTAVTTSSPTSGVALSKYINGEQLTPNDYVALDNLSGGGRPKVLGADRGDEELLRARAGLPKSNASAGGAEDTNIPRYTPITSTEQLAAAMGYTSPEEEKRLRKASVTNQRILAIGDALRHIGNIANTVRYAPSQQFNSPVTDEIARYERGKALRDKANAALLTYQQQKERQDALQRRWENELEYKRQKEEAAAKARADKAKDARDKWQATLKYNKERDDKNLAFKKEQDKWKREETARRNDVYVAKASGGGGSRKGRSVSGGTRAGYSGGKYWAYDEDGNIHYYPNKTMWEQGVNQFSSGLTNTETYNNGKEQKGRARSTASKGGELARNAAAKKNAATKGKTPSKGKTTAKGKPTNNSGFFKK